MTRLKILDVLNRLIADIEANQRNLTQQAPRETESAWVFYIQTRNNLLLRAAEELASDTSSEPNQKEQP